MMARRWSAVAASLAEVGIDAVALFPLSAPFSRRRREAAYRTPPHLVRGRPDWAPTGIGAPPSRWLAGRHPGALDFGAKMPPRQPAGCRRSGAHYIFTTFEDRRRP